MGTDHSVSDPGCEFCRIIRGETDAHIVWQDDGAIAFFPLAPAVAGHTLVVPKEHLTDYWAADEAVVEHLASAVLLVGAGIQRALQPEGMNLISSAGEAASQSVFHLHMHVVPRWTHDRLGQIWPPDKHLPPQLEDDLADRVRDGIRKSAVQSGHDHKRDADAKDRGIEEGDGTRPQ